jgi:parvulin-like peptidyl-prolyl isomerase
VGAKPGQSNKTAGFKRLALVVFGAIFAALFVGFAIAQGIGEPSVPSGDVALVQSVPSEIGHVSEAQYKRAALQQLERLSLKKLPKPGTKKSEELTEAAMGELLSEIWVIGEAEELGITVTEKQVENELANVKKQNFPTEKAFQEFLKTSHFTPEEVNKKLEVKLLSTKIQEQVTNEGEPASNAEIEEYYEAEKAAQFTEKPSRDIRLILNKEKSEVEKAKEALEADNSPASWKKVAPKYSEDPTSSSKGGLQEKISEEVLQGPLKKAIFGSEIGELVGPVSYQGNYLLIEVVKENPEHVKSLGEVRSQISTTLTQQKQQQHFTEFVGEFESKWSARSFCASGFIIKRCANFKGTGHPATALPNCYEANPKTPPTECPAPVEQNKPAVPGSVTATKLTGEPLVQRPLPEPEASKAASGGGNSEALEKAVEEASE